MAKKVTTLKKQAFFIILFLLTFVLIGKAQELDEVDAAKLICKLSKSKIPNLQFVCIPLDNFILLQKKHTYLKFYFSIIRDAKSPIKAAPFTPTGKSLTIILDEIKIDIEKFLIVEEIVITNVVLPPKESLISTQNAIRRNAIASTQQYINAYNLEYKEYLLLNTNMEQWSEEVKTTKNGFTALSKSYLDNIDIVGLDQLSLSLFIGSAGLDMFKNIIPGLQKLKNSINDKQKLINKLLKKERKKINTMVQTGLQFAEGEQQFLTKQLFTIDSNIQIINQKSKVSRDSFELASTNYLKISKAEKDLLEAQLKSSLTPLNELLAEQKKLKNSYNVGKAAYKNFEYTGCPKKLSYENCKDHPEAKKEYMDEKIAWSERLNVKLTAINAKTLEVDIASANYKKTQKKVNVELAKINKIIAEMLAEYTSKIKKYQNLIKDLEIKKNELNVFLTANKNDYLKIESFKIK